MTKTQQEEIIRRVESNDLDGAHTEIDQLLQEYARSDETQADDLADVLILKATVLLREEAYADALPVLNDVIELEPSNPVALLMLGTALAQIERDDDARRVFQIVARLADEPWRSEAENALDVLLQDIDRQRIRVSIVCGEGLDSFVQPMRRILEETCEVRLYTVASTRDVAEALEWADVCWFEWCDDTLVKASQTMPKACKVVCRIHSYEVFTDMPATVNWGFVDQIVFVAEHVRDIFEATISGCQTPRVVIPNGVDLSKYTFRTREPGFDLAYVGYINYKKNLPLLLQIISRLVAIDERYKLHIAGAFQDLRFRIYFDHMVRTLGLKDHVAYAGWTDDVDDWLEDKDYILSTSVFESFGMSIAEGMAKGLKPVVHNWPGAIGLYPEEMLFGTVEEAVQMVVAAKFESRSYRAFITEHYELRAQVGRVRQMMEQLVSLPEVERELAA
jgi:hypothetical protein